MSTRAPLALVLVLLAGCHPASAPSEPPAPSTDPTETPATATTTATATSTNEAKTERYLAEERWNDAEPLPPEPEPEPELAPPSEAEMRAWDRRDPAAEKRLYKWDKAHFGMLQGFFHDLECLHDHLVDAGNAGRGATPGSKRANVWRTQKQALVMDLDALQKRFFAADPDLLSSSKFAGMFLEAHELLMHTFPRAYDEDDQTQIDRAKAHWAIVMAKIDRYTRALGLTPTRPSAAYCRALGQP